LESVSGGCFQESELAECFYIKWNSDLIVFYYSNFKDIGIKF
jgi:hypothetical protein